MESWWDLSSETKAEIKVLSALLFGFVLKVVDLVYREDKKNPNEPIDLKKYLWGNGNKWRIIGSILFIMGLAFVLPDVFVTRLMNIQYDEMAIGWFGVIALGYLADNLTLMKYSVSFRFTEWLEHKLDIKERKRRNEQR